MIIPEADLKINLHTHTCYCDGADKPEEIVLSAIEKGFDFLGFSGHEYAPYDEEYCMSPEETGQYIEEILALKEKYSKKIKIYLGTERDCFSPGSNYEYDYIIGSVHYLLKNGEYLPIDNTELIMCENVEKYYHGSFRYYVEDYYDTIADVVTRTNADIVGHFDLISKFNENCRYFDEHSHWYKKAALTAMARVAESRPIIEINTGAMARGYRSRPYPDLFLIDEAKRLKCPLIFSSDCHDRNMLDYAYEETVELI